MRTPFKPAHRARTHKRGPVLLFAAAILLGLALRAELFLTSVQSVQPSSDESIHALLATSIREGAAPLLFLAQPYLFPIESYLVAPFTPRTPVDAADIRLPIAAMHLLALALQLFAASLWIPRGSPRWIAYALLLLPSPYVLMIQSMYSMPGYAFLMLGGFAMLICAERFAQTANPRAVWLVALGFIGGIGYGSHQLIAVFLIPAILRSMLAPAEISRLHRSLAIGSGILVGLFPYMLARIVFPGAHAAAENILPAGRILDRLWHPALIHTWPGTLGWRLSPFPDQAALPAKWPLVDAAMGPLLLALLVAYAVLSVHRRIRVDNRERWTLRPGDVPWIIVLLNLFIFAVGERATSASYRYMLPAAIAFPYLLADLAARAPRARIPVAAIAAILLTVNLDGTRRLHEIWRQPGFAERTAGVPDLAPALNYLRERGIDRAVASYGAAYRIHLQSGRTVICAQPYNERFPHWPIPFVEEVWSGRPLAYVLTEHIRFLKPSIFERHLRRMGVMARVHTAGAFRVYSDFEPASPPRPQRRLSTRDLRLDASDAPETAHRLVDQDTESIWTTTNTMRGGEWIDLQWAAPAPVERIVLVYGRYAHDAPDAYRVVLQAGSEERARLDGVKADLDKFELDAGRPRYGRWVQSFHFGGVLADAARIEIARPHTNRHWTVAEIEVYVGERGPAQGGAAAMEHDP